MNKIDPASNAAHMAHITTNTSSKRKDPSTSSAHQPQAASSTLKNKMQNWFAQAGISPPNATELGLDAQRKVQRRKIIQQQRQLRNLERILSLALEFSPAQGQEENLDPDWFFSFIKLAEEIHSPTMQELWAKIFATEIGQPGTFSLRSLNILQQLTQRDARIFSLAVSLASRRSGDYSPRLLFGYYYKPSLLSMMGLKRGGQLNLAQFGLTYPDLLALMDLGLIYNSEIESGELSTQKRNEWRIGGETLHMTPRNRGTLLNYYKFTAAGAELSRLVPVKAQPDYINILKRTFNSAFDIH
ncbi:TIGR03899 family protein [Bowmanella pacifica]|uniref:TIGR03899 family protein n=1 Tax=Bowmanella pacifica TaxID=502051 RepID=A0A918DP81_9ALTE|nr:TIGR03899 family protein [Bowmanella pacifica]GGO75151.1 hypothetical protein GCM10010982_39620 [Bowmanella pacifica]